MTTVMYEPGGSNIPGGNVPLGTHPPVPDTQMSAKGTLFGETTADSLTRFISSLTHHPTHPACRIELLLEGHVGNLSSMIHLQTVYTLTFNY